MEAGDFLRRALPWPADGEPGWINVHWWVTAKTETGKERAKFVRGLPFRRQEDFERCVAELQSQRVDVYMCLSRQAETKQLRRGGVVAAKSQKNALCLKSLWLEIDVDDDPEKDVYRSIQEAAQGLAAFLASSLMPVPSGIVRSGGGLHVYWFLDRPLPSAAWLPLAQGLRILAETHNLRFDKGVTADYARVLRVPGTTNFKHGTQRPVKIATGQGVEYDPVDLAFLIGLVPPDRAKVISEPEEPVPGIEKLREQRPSDLFRGIPADAPPVGDELDPTKIFMKGGCPLLRHIVDRRGRGQSQGMWNLTTLACTFLHNGNKIAHAMSSGYEGYSYDETEELWKRKQRERKTNGLRWPSCAAFLNEGSKQCAGCPHWNKINGPLALANAPLALAESPAGANGAAGSSTATDRTDRFAVFAPGPVDAPFLLPADCFYQDGYVIQETKKFDKDGKPLKPKMQPLFHNKIYLAEVFDTPTGHVLHLGVNRHLGKDCAVDLPVTALDGGRQQVECMHSQSLYPATNIGQVKDFVMSWISTLNRSKAAANTVPFGWHREGEKFLGFAYGGTVYMADGTELASGYIDPQLREFYAPTGESKFWLEACKLITDQHRPHLDAMVAAAFGAPLMMAAGEYACMLSAFGESGGNKSSAQFVGAAVWGHPKLTRESLQTTPKSISEKMGRLSCLPIFWDEVKDKKAQQRAADVMFQGTEGAGAGRLKSNLEFQKRQSYQTLIVCSANVSMVDFCSAAYSHTDAAHYRIFEYEVPHPGNDFIGKMNSEDATEVIHRLERNFGRAGAQYAKWLGSNADHAYARTREIHKQFKKIVGREGDTKERFWAALCSSILAGAEFANQVLGTEFDLPALLRFLVKVYGDNRQRLKDDGVGEGGMALVEDTLARIVKFFHDRALWTHDIPIRKGNFQKQVPLHAPEYKFGRAPEVHWVVERRLLIIARSGIDAFMKADGKGDVGYGHFIRGMGKFYRAVMKRITPASGTQFSPGQKAYCLIIPIPPDHPLEEVLFRYSRPSNEVQVGGADGGQSKS